MTAVFEFMWHWSQLERRVVQLACFLADWSELTQSVEKFLRDVMIVEERGHVLWTGSLARGWQPETEEDWSLQFGSPLSVLRRIRLGEGGFLRDHGRLRSIIDLYYPKKEVARFDELLREEIGHVRWNQRISARFRGTSAWRAAGIEAKQAYRNDSLKPKVVGLFEQIWTREFEDASA